MRRPRHRDALAVNARWLVCVALIAFGGVVRGGDAPVVWEALGASARSAALALPTGGKTGFTLIPSASTGITFSNFVPVERYTTNQIYLNGSGVAAGDVDQDGWCDVFFAGLEGRSRLYRNEGAWRFTDITASAGLTHLPADATGAALVDINGDGALDIVVNSVGQGTLCFTNSGRGHFTLWASLNPARSGASLAFADVDGDGKLDLYISNYRLSSVRDDPGARYRVGLKDGRQQVLEYNGRPTSNPELEGRFVLSDTGKIIEKGEVDALYLNLGGGEFRLASFTDGSFLDEEGRSLASAPHDWGLSAMFRDIDGDGLPDLYVCNDFESPDRVWINQGGGRFRALRKSALRHLSLFSMGIDFADINRDGRDDFFVVDMMGRTPLSRQLQIGGVPPYETPIGGGLERPQYSQNTLFLSQTDGSFVDVAFHAGVQASGWSWTPIFLDVDLDGYEDLLITTGHQRDAMNADVIERSSETIGSGKATFRELLELNNRFARLDPPHVTFRNRGDGTFEERASLWGFDTRAVSHGMCLADLDNDGDMDLLVNNLNGEAGVYRNTGTGSRIAVRLKGRSGNTQGIGARIWVRGGAVPEQTQEFIAGGRYLSSDQAQRVFASGASGRDMEIEVRWRDGARSKISGVRPGRVYEISEPRPLSTPDATRRPSPAAQPLFMDVSERLGHTHKEEFYNDLARQPLLPWRLSQLGPGVCWHDFDGDGWLDLAIGGGRSGVIALFRGDARGGFTSVTNGAFSRPLARDATGLAGIGSLLIAGSANYEDGATNGGAIRVYDTAKGTSGESVLGPLASTGPIALADIDGDGDLDLFVGGRVLGGHFPEPVASQWLRNENGRFLKAQRFEGFGLVSGVVFSDLDGDGLPDLVAVCEWGPLRFLHNTKGELTPWDPPVILPRRIGDARRLATFGALNGWWHGVAAVDLDGDGRMDLVASNWGSNGRYQASPDQPWILYFGDLSGGAFVDLIEARPFAGRELPERSWRLVRAALPFLNERIPSYEAYGTMSAHEIYQQRLAACRKIEIVLSDSMAFLNRGDHFEAVELPAEAQWTPGWGVSVADVDGDGLEDVFLSQNFFPMNPETARQDGGKGLWLRGDGHGGLTTMTALESGVAIDGDQRGCAVGDFDNDGRVDLVVAQNGGPTRLLRNQGARPGLRVRLRYGPQNTTATGACLRLVYGAESKGPAREIHSGSGYWSQDAAVQVMGRARTPSGVWVRWPGGEENTYPLTGEPQEVEIDRSTGKVIVKQ
ncbi:MAG: VCBS repeat-containing protein [Verrucomicrobia bacterium]|nr:VCBS repeat-containing protein [Verrucomicrobiota bacterium]